MNLSQAWADRPSLYDLQLFQVAGTPVTVATLVTVALVLVATLVFSRLAQRGATRLLRRRGLRDEGTVAAVVRLLHYTIVVVGVGVAVETIGIDLSTFVAAGAVLAVAIGFAMQNVTQNFLSGVILLMERTIKPGDILEVDDQPVRVVRMGIRATVVRTRDESELILPNSILGQESVTNYTLRDNLFRLRATVGVRYSSDLELVREVLERTAAAIDWRLQKHDPVVLLAGFGSSSVDYDVSVWIDDPWLAQTRGSQLNEAIWRALEEAGITIAFPQLDVHFDAPVTEGLSAVGQ